MKSAEITLFPQTGLLKEDKQKSRDRSRKKVAAKERKPAKNFELLVGIFSLT